MQFSCQKSGREPQSVAVGHVAAVRGGKGVTTVAATAVVTVTGDDQNSS